MRQLFVLLLLIPYLANAQEDEGIRFEECLTWKQVQAKAKDEGKLIFVDCFTPSCVQCVVMDNKIFPNDSVGRYMNQHFIAIKVQMDSTNQGNEKKWNSDIYRVMKKYKINTYPSFLFFSADGKLVHRGVGYQGVNDFIPLAINALTPEKQYNTLLDDYQKGKMDYFAMPYLARVSKSLGASNLYVKISKAYVNNYLLRLEDQQLYTKAKLLLLYEFIHSSRGAGFRFFRTNYNRIDSILGKDVAERKMMTVIGDEEVKPYIVATKSRLDWSIIERRLVRKCGNLGEMEYREQRLGYAWKEQDWVNFQKFYVLYFEIAGSLNIYHINNISWAIFLHSNDPLVLKTALKIMDARKEADVNGRDTYANLLYKLGERSAAIEWEQKTVVLEREIAFRENRVSNNIYQQTLDKMKNGQPTW